MSKPFTLTVRSPPPYKPPMRVLPKSMIALPRPAVAFPFIGFGIAVVFATLWTGVALTQNNLEVQSIDLCHHVMFVDHLQTPLAAVNREFVGQYPVLAHRLATVWLLIYRNPLMAVRAAALASVLVMLVAQWYLLRTRYSGAVALLVLVAWQCLCTRCKLGDINHFLWDFQYNYSRAVSAAALWTMILSFAVPPSRYRGLNLLVAVGLAAFAFRCHIAAGSLALAACGTWCVVNIIRRDLFLGIGGLLALSITAALMLAFTDEWRYLASLQHDNGPLPIRHAAFVMLWIPTAVIGLGVALWLSRNGRELTMTPTVAVLCGLLPAAVLQGYMLYGKDVTHTVGSYPYNQMLFYTFGLASLLGFVSLPLPSGSRPWVWALSLAAAFACVWTMLETDPRRARSGHDPICVLNELRSHNVSLTGGYYYDPSLEHASYIVSRCLLGAGSDYCARYRLHCHLRKPQDLFREPALQFLIVPANVDIDAVLGSKTPRERIGNYWKCSLAGWKS